MQEKDPIEQSTQNKEENQKGKKNIKKYSNSPNSNFPFHPKKNSPTIVSSRCFNVIIMNEIE